MRVVKCWIGVSIENINVFIIIETKNIMILNIKKYWIMMDTKLKIYMMLLITVNVLWATDMFYT